MAFGGQALSGPLGSTGGNGGLSEEALAEQKKKQEKDAQKTNAASAAALFIPVVGPLVAGGIQAAGANKAKKDAASSGPRPKHRRATAALQAGKDRKAKRLQALALLSQSVSDFSSGIR